MNDTMAGPVITDTSREELEEREVSALGRVMALFRSVDPGLRVGDGTWSARDVLAHLVNVIERYTNPKPTLGSTPREVDAVNAAELRSLGGLSVGDLVERLEASGARYQTVWRTLPLELEFPFHAGLPLDVASLRCNWIGELLIHGRDVAVAAGRPWPIGEREGLLPLRMVFRLAPAYVRTGEAEGVRVGFSAAGGRPMTVAVRDGAAVVEPGLERAGSVIGGPAVPLLLLMYARASLREAEAMGLEVSGRREEADRLTGALERP